MSDSRASGATPLEGADILSEVPGQTGVLLWKTLRSLRLWASSSPSERAAELFAPGARQRRDAEITAGEVGPQLNRPLRGLTALLDPSEAMGKEQVAAACGSIAAWARESGELATAFAFSEAAAMASPDDADLALQVARDARAEGDRKRAEDWCERTVLLSRQSASWDACTRAVLTLAIMAKERGNLPAGRQLANRALELSTRHALSEPRAMALHELFLNSVEYVDVHLARRYADRAFRAYGACHPHIHYLSHDLYVLWLTRGQFGRALPALRSISPFFPERERLMPAANLVRAAGGMGDRREFRRGWAVAAPMLEWRQDHGSVGSALLSMARGASGVGEWELARTMAERARAVSEEKGEWALVFAAESTLGCVRDRRSALAPLAR